MRKTLDLSVNPSFVKAYSDGYPLISPEFIDNWSNDIEEGTILKLLDNKKHCIAKG
jgi:23S rRNA (cytosine1962-C5)-methyltransferase